MSSFIGSQGLVRAFKTMLFILPLLIAERGFGQWTDDRSVNTPVCTASADQSGVRIASDGSRGAILAWNDYRSGTTSNIYLQRLDKNGVPQWANDGIPIYAQSEQQTLVDIFPDGAGGAIIGWIDSRSGSPIAYLQRISGEGLPQWTAGGVAVAATVAIAENRSGDTFVVWSSTGDIYAQKVSISGILQWQSGGVVVCSDTSFQSSPVVAADGTGGAVVAWSDSRGSYRGSRRSVFSQALASNGTTKWDPAGSLVDSSTYSEYYQMPPPSGITADSAGNAIILHSQGLGPAYSGSPLAKNLGTNFYCTKMSSTGDRQWGPVYIDGLGSPGIVCGFASDNLGGAVITYTWPVAGCATHILSTGALGWQIGVAHAEFPCSASDNQGGYMFVYSSTHAFARHVNDFGVMDWPGEVPVSVAGGSQSHVVAVPNGLNGAIVAWVDSRNGNNDIYAQNIPGIGVPRNDITVRDACGDHQVLTFGQHPVATDGIDQSLGEASLPPLPPTGVFDARFVLPGLTSSWKDFRNDTLKSASWRMTFQPGSCGYPFTFTWDTVSLTGGSYCLRDEVTGTLVSVNMKMQSSYTLNNSGIASLRIDFSMDITRNVSYENSWNLVSVPVAADNMNLGFLFPYGRSPAYGYDSGYVPVTTLTPGKGYWVEFNGPSSCFFRGARVTPGDITVGAGWNIVGPFDAPVPVAGITTTPSGIILSSFWGYSGGYAEATTLASGYGYWICVSQAGVLHLQGGNLIAQAKIAGHRESWTRLEFTDLKGSRSNVYLAKPDEIRGPQGLPPVPPSGILDVRYATNTSVEPLGKTLHEVQINSARYPLQIGASNLGGRTLKVKDEINGTILDQTLGEGNRITVTAPLTRLTIEESGQSASVPIDWELSQNFPNPFNPTTNIRYGLPKASYVTLKIFDMLGREVATLVNGAQEPGYKSVQWNGTTAASGVYYYRLQAGEFVKTKKLVLLR